MADNLTPEQRRACMQAVKGSNTRPERIVRAMLHGLGCRFARSGAALLGKPDVVMPARRSVVFVHGCFWHDHDCRRGKRKPVTNADYWRAKIARNAKRDRRAIAALKRDRWRVLVVWECETRNNTRLTRRLSRFVCTDVC